MLDNCIVKEIVPNGTQSEQEQLDIISRHRKRMAKDNNTFPHSPLSLDVEQVRCTLKDVLRLRGQKSYKKPAVTLSDPPPGRVLREPQGPLCAAPGPRDVGQRDLVGTHAHDSL